MAWLGGVAHSVQGCHDNDADAYAAVVSVQRAYPKNQRKNRVFLCHKRASERPAYYFVSD